MMLGIRQELDRKRFVGWIADELKACGINPDGAPRSAMILLNEFLSSEKIGFEDDRYGWDLEAARVLAHEFEIDHWEPRP